MDGKKGRPEAGRKNGRSGPLLHLAVEREIEKAMTDGRGVIRTKKTFHREARVKCASIANRIAVLMDGLDATGKWTAKYAEKGEPIEDVAEWIEHRLAELRSVAEGLFARVEELDRELLRHSAFGEAPERDDDPA